MSALSHIFEGGVSTEQPVAPVAVDGDWSRVHATTAPASAAAATRAGDEVVRLQQLVGSRTSAATFGGAPAVVPSRPRREGNVRDVFTGILVFLAAIALIVAAATATLVLTQRSPEGDALRTLDQVQTVLDSQITSVNSSLARLTDSRDAQLATAAALKKPLDTAAAQQKSGEMDAHALDADALAAARKARGAYESALTKLTIPRAVAPYSAPSVDKASLTSIGAAIDGANAEVAAAEATSDEVVAARGTLAGLQATFADALRALVASVPDAATALSMGNPDADQSFRDALTAAATDVAALSPDALEQLAATLPAYGAAVTALQGDQQRAVAQAAAVEAAAQAAAREDAARRAANQSSGGGGTSAPGTSDKPSKGSGGSSDAPSKGSGDAPPAGSTDSPPAGSGDTPPAGSGDTPPAGSGDTPPPSGSGGSASGDPGSAGTTAP